MKQLWMTLALTICFYALSAQQTGDTIVVNSFKYGSTSRDSLITFPPGNLSFEKIILKYNMRCKNALVSTQSAPNQGCGEWDYSCNTFIVDSAQIEKVPSTHPSHTINGFNDTIFRYSTQPISDLYQFHQITVVTDSIISENQTMVGSGNAPVSLLLKTDEKSGRSFILFTAAELLSAGFTSGNIDGIILSVANNGGIANFFKIGIQHSTIMMLDADSVPLTGSTNVFNSNHTFINGNNRIQFHTPFIWDGVNNLIFDFSFTNTIPGTAIMLNGHASPLTKSLYANNHYALDLSSSGLVNLNTTNLAGISGEITVGLRTYGYPDKMPANTSLLYGYASAAGQRHLNLHLPWGNGNVYFDCGYSGSYDRIYKTALPEEYGGQWHQWVFTKNTTTGNMSIYLNGNLWHSGTGMTKPINLLHLMLGNNNTGNNPFPGKINELSIWDKALSANEIYAWRNKPLDSTHTSWNHLLAYYKTHEAIGDSIKDTKSNVYSTGTDLHWSYDRGDQLTSLFLSSDLRPNVVLLRGNYMLDTTSIIVTDSVTRSPNKVKEFAIVPAPSGTLQHDVVSLVSITPLYAATPRNVYDGDADTLRYSMVVVPDDSIQITTLNYLKRYPWYNEIMSFVTPYGKGLDLGVDGKTWYFDVTDFAPLLQGNKRMMMTGGVWQEEMDIDFLFIVGTPPREVIEFRQLWQGSARTGQASIASINNNSRYAPVIVPLDADGEQFKVRAVITGHGSEGEFHQNGGVVNHYFSVNSTTNNFAWQITEECSFNPVFPQGGTWVYDRQGWCPGQYSLLKELDITSLVNSDTTATLDYNCSSPANASGDYRYLAAFQLVTYGEPNHLLDASLLEILAPTDKIVNARKNPVCANPVIMIQNTGSTTLTSVEIAYWLNSASIKQQYVWIGSLGFLETATIILPTADLWQYDYQNSGNVFHAALIKANGILDDYAYNNTLRSSFDVTDKVPEKFVIEFKTNNYPTHNTYKIIDAAGNTMPGSSPLTTANTIYRDTFELDGCYTLLVTDAGQDGLQWWANTAQGTGYVRLKSATGALLKTFQPDFGGGFEYSFTTHGIISINEPSTDPSVRIFPNPASDLFYIIGDDLENADISLVDLLGRTLKTPIDRNGLNITVYTNGLPKGIYMIHIRKPTGDLVKKVIVP